MYFAYKKLKFGPIKKVSLNYQSLNKIDELTCFLLCFPKKQKIRELRCLLDPLISPFRTHGGPVDTPIWTDNSIL